MLTKKLHTLIIPLTIVVGGMALDGGGLHAQQVGQRLQFLDLRSSVAAVDTSHLDSSSFNAQRDTIPPATGAGDTLPYRIPPLSTLRIPRDSAGSSPTVPVPLSALSPLPSRTDLFGSEFSRSGSISRGFLVGSNRDATVVSGFRLQFSGPVTNDIQVNAALTDENSPIQPEGTTQSLREVDKVSIDLNGPAFGLTLGDFFFQRSVAQAGEFGGVSKKVQGLRGSVEIEPSGISGLRSTVGVLGASSRAEYHTQLLNGREGVQGPYRLTGKNNEQYIVVVAGSERVSINGEEMVRGETRDYVIDYATGEITFTTARMVTSDSRIYVDFEYADRNYARNIVGADIESSIGSDAFRLGLSFLQEADDPDNPVGGPLDATVASLLRASGDDRLKASSSGIFFIGVDSLTGKGRGQYAKRDTLLPGGVYQVLVYAPGDPDAVFNVTFSRVDAVPNDSLGYRRVRGGEYVLAGLGAGTHVPRIFYEAPKLQRSFTGNVSSNLGGGLRISAEGSRSSLDRNRLSTIDDIADDGSAYRLALSFEPHDLRLFGSSLGRFRADLDQRFIDERFASFGRIDPVEYARDWDVAFSGESSEWRRQFSASYAPWSPMTFTTFLGTLARSDGNTSERRRGGVAFNDSSGFEATGSAERVRRRDERSLETSTWDRYSAFAALSLGFGRPSLSFRMQERAERPDSLDVLAQGGFRFTEIAPRFETTLGKGWTIAGTASWRTEDSSLAGAMAPAFRSGFGAIQTLYAGRPDASFSFDLQTRRTSYSEAFRVRGNRDTRTTLVRGQGSFRAIRRAVETRLFYEFSSQQSSRLERVFIRVSPGTGQYRYVGDTNGNGLTDESEFQPVRYDGDYASILIPGETLVPVNAVKASLRLRIRFRDLGFGRVLSRFSTESYARVEEKSTDPSSGSIASLDLARFLNPTSTISGQQLMTHDLYFDESNPDLSLRLRATDSRGLTQLVSAPISSYANERSLRVRARLSTEINDQIDISLRRDRSLGDLLSSRNRDLVLTGGTNDLGYRVDRNWELGLVLGFLRSENIIPGNAGIADLNEQGVRVTYGVPAKGSVRAEVRREEITLTNTAATSIIPYEMTGGRPVGRSWFLEVRADIRLTDIIQLSSAYTGRMENTSRIVHTARAEVRAVF